MPVVSAAIILDGLGILGWRWTYWVEDGLFSVDSQIHYGPERRAPGY